MFVGILKIVISIIIGLSWIFFSGDGSEEIALLLGLFVLVILFVKPTKLKLIREDEKYKEAIHNKKIRQARLEEARIVAKIQTQKEKETKSSKPRGEK